MQDPAPISRQIWDMKYRLRVDGQPAEATPQDSWHRVAAALAEAEAPATRAQGAARFQGAMEGYRFLPAGRILAGAARQRHRKRSQF